MKPVWIFTNKEYQKTSTDNKIRKSPGWNIGYLMGEYGENSKVILLILTVFENSKIRVI